MKYSQNRSIIMLKFGSFSIRGRVLMIDCHTTRQTSGSKNTAPRNRVMRIINSILQFYVPLNGKGMHVTNKNKLPSYYNLRLGIIIITINKQYICRRET